MARGIGQFREPSDLLGSFFNSAARTISQTLITNTLGIYSVKSAPYNAAGDGTTNDTASIQAAIDAAEDAGGGLVYFPPGIYLSERVRMDGDDVTLFGPGAVLKMSPLGVGAVDTSALLSIAGDRNSVMFLELDGNKASLPPDNSRLININACEDAYVYGCYLHDNRAWIDPNLAMPALEDVSNQLQANDAIQVINATRATIEHCRIVNAGHNGIRIGGAVDGAGVGVAGNLNKIYDCVIIDWVHGRGIRTYSGTNLHIRGCYIYGSWAGAEQGSNILHDPGSGDNGRLAHVLIEDCQCIRVNGSGAQALKVSSSGLCIVRGGLYSVDSANHQAVRLEDGQAKVIFEGDVKIKPNILWTPANQSGSSIYQGQISSQTVGGVGGFAQFTLAGSSTALAIGKSLFVRGSGVNAYDREHIISAVSGMQVTTNIAYDAGSILSTNFCHSGVDKVVIRDCEIGDDTWDHGAWMENVCSPYIDIERTLFTAKFGHTGTFNGLDWEYINDRNLGKFRFVNNEIVSNNTTALRFIRNSAIYPLARDLSGKVICYGNTIRNVSPTSGTTPVFFYDTDSISQSSGTAAMTSANAGGFVIYTVAAAHGLRVGDTVTVASHSVGGYNGAQAVTARTATTFTTDKVYSSNGTGGSWSATITFPNRATIFSSDGERTNCYLGTAIPSGVDTVFQRGDRVRNTTPSAAGTPGWACTTAGALDASVGTFGTEAVLT